MPVAVGARVWGARPTRDGVGAARILRSCEQAKGSGRDYLQENVQP